MLILLGLAPTGLSLEPSKQLLSSSTIYKMYLCTQTF